MIIASYINYNHTIGNWINNQEMDPDSVRFAVKPACFKTPVVLDSHNPPLSDIISMVVYKIS